MTKAEKIIEGLQIQMKYDNGGYCAAEHDIFYGPLNAFEDEEGVLTKSDKNRLEELGWFIDEECWAIFT